MTKERANKEQHEFAIGCRLIEALGCPASYVGHGIDGVEPDQVYSIAGKRIGIEVSTAFYERRHGESEWKFVNGKLARGENGITPIYKNFGPGAITPTESLDVLLLTSLQYELDDKCGINYQNVDEAWLCIEAHASLTEVWEMDRLVKQLQLPSDHRFKRIYVCFYPSTRDGGGFRVYNLLTGEVITLRLERGWRVLNQLWIWLAFQLFRLRHSVRPKLARTHSHRTLDKVPRPRRSRVEENNEGRVLTFDILFICPLSPPASEQTIRSTSPSLPVPLN